MYSRREYEMIRDIFGGLERTETTCEQAGRLSSRRFALESGLSLHVNPENVNGIRFVVTPTEPIIRRGS